MGLFWRGEPWTEQKADRPAGWGGNLDDLAPYRPLDPLVYRVVGRAGVERLKPRNQPVSLAGVLGLVYLVVVAGLLAGGVIFWIRALQIWLR